MHIMHSPSVKKLIRILVLNGCGCIATFSSIPSVERFCWIVWKILIFGNFCCGFSSLNVFMALNVSSLHLKNINLILSHANVDWFSKCPREINWNKIEIYNELAFPVRFAALFFISIFQLSCAVGTVESVGSDAER